MKVSLNTIKNWFKTGLKPTQDQFWNTFDSFWHKDEKIGIKNIDNLGKILDRKAEAEALDSHLTDSNAHKSLFDEKAPISHLTDSNAHKSLFESKASLEMVEGHFEDPEAHQALFDQKVDTSHLTDSNAHKSLFDEKAPVSHLTDSNAHQSLFDQKIDVSHLTDSNAHKSLFDKKVDKVPGKDLSSNDFTDDDKAKLDSLNVPLTKIIQNDYTLANEDNLGHLFVEKSCNITITSSQLGAFVRNTFSVASGETVNLTGDLKESINGPAFCHIIQSPDGTFTLFQV